MPDLKFNSQPTKEDVLEILEEVEDKEVVKQFAMHQPFVLSGLDDKEEFKSRMAFVDAYKDEFAEIHEQIKQKYTKKGPMNEFDYLKDDTFRLNAGVVDAKDNKMFLVDMMKDYMTYQHIKGELSTPLFHSFLSKDSKKENEFRKQTLTKKETDFLIDDSSFSEEKKKGIRECRKWMYRNCSKSGMFNETGSKRNYIDSFAKRPVSIQVNTLYQIERGFYKYNDEGFSNEKKAMSEDYIPSKSSLKNKLVRTKKNPYNLYKKATGDFFYWSRMERALKKSDEKSDTINTHYAARINNPIEDVNEIKRVNAALKAFGEERDNYLECVKKYVKDHSAKMYKKMIDAGNRIQRLVKSSEHSAALEKIDNMNNDKKPITSFLDLTKEMRKARKMDDNSINKIVKEKATDAVDLGLTIKGLGDKAYSAGSSVAKMITASKAIDKVTRGFTFATAISTAYTTIKSGLMAMISWGRRKKAAKVQKKNKENRDILANENDLESRKINDIAKVSKKRNDLKAKSYAAESSFAAASVGFTVLGLVGIVAMPLTIAGGIVGAAGFAVKYALDYYTRKDTASKAIDSRVKTEEYEKKLESDNEKTPRRRNYEEHRKFIDIKVDERKRILDEKRMRFNEKESGRKVLDSYVNDNDKIKNRIRENWAVERGNISIYSFCADQDHENVMEAYRNMFLKNPEGPLDEDNLLTPVQVKQYMSLNSEDLKLTGQTEEQAKRRAMFKELMMSEGVQTKAPKNMDEANKMIRPKQKKEVKKEEAIEQKPNNNA